MNTVKKIIAFSVVIFISFRLIVISVSASFAAGGAIAAEELTELLGTILFSSGAYTQEQINGMSLYEMESNLKNGLNNGTIDPARVSESIPFYDNSSGTWTESIPIYGGNSSWSESIPKIEDMTLWDLFCYLNRIPNSYTTIKPVVNEATNEWFADMVKDGTLQDKLHERAYEISGMDLQGSGAVLKLYYRNQGSAYAEIDRYRIVYCEYVEVQDVGDGTYNFYCRNPVREVTYNLKGELQDVYDLNGQSSAVYSQIKVGDNFSISGDCRRLDDGSQIDTTGEAIPVIGEADGTQVTPDMLNPDGTVTIDGTTYYPKDFIDWDKFKDPAIIDLLNQILAKIDTTPIIVQDKPIVDVDNIEVSVPEELSDFAVPIGIANVFPFCLPWDFARGIKMLLAKPEVPVFKTEIDLTNFCGFDLGVIPLEVSFEKWEPAVIIFRWFFQLIYIIVLIKLTPKICKGAG